MKISGNTILITGGSTGIGFELAQRLIERKNKVIITGRDQKKLDTAKVKCPELHTIRSDVSNLKDIESLFTEVTRTFPQLNLLINNAGIMRVINLNEQGDTNLTQEIEINLCGPIRMINTFLPHLKKQAESGIVNVSSGLAFVPLPTSPVYCATKAALHSYTQSLRVQLKKSNVKVFELAPPATETELLHSATGPGDMDGISIMPVQAMVAAAIKGIETDRWEIRPGQSNQLKLMSRIAPEFIFKQLSRPIDGMLARSKN